MRNDASTPFTPNSLPASERSDDAVARPSHLCAKDVDSQRAARALNALLLDSSRDCIVVLDLDGRIRFVSPGGMEAMEIDDIGPLLGRSWLKVWFGADREAAVAAVGLARAGGVGRFQGWRPTAKGTPKWWDVMICALPSVDGHPEILASVGRDITDMKLAQQRLEASEAQFRTLAQAMPHHVWTAPPDGQLDWFNDRVYAYSGLEPGQLVGVGWASIVHPDDVATAGERWAQALASGTTYETEFRLRRSDGDYRWHLARAVPIRDADGTVTRWVGTNTDIAEQKKTVEALAHLNAFLERETAERAVSRDRLWMNAADLMLVVGADGRIEAANPAWQSVLGWTEHALVGRRLIDFVHPADAQALETALANIDRGDPVRRVTFRCTRQSGQHLAIEWSLVGASGSVSGIGRELVPGV